MNLDELERVEVEWLDSAGDPEWRPLARALDELGAVPVHRSVGWLLVESSSWVLLAQSVRPGDDSHRPMVADTLEIPRPAVLAVHRLERAPARRRRRRDTSPDAVARP